MAVPAEMQQRAGASPAEPGSALAHAALCLAIAALFPIIAFRFHGAPILRSGHEHALLDLGIALSACFCSLQALMRYQSRPQPMFLWLSAGYLASGLLDGVHAMLSLEQAGAVNSDRISWSWTISAVVLGTYVALSLARKLSEDASLRPRRDTLLVGGITLLLIGTLVPVILGATLPPAFFATFPVHRPFEFLPAVSMTLALVLVLDRRATLDPALRNTVMLSLAIYISLHAGVMAWSRQPLDGFVGVSHLAKLLAHWLVLLGLLRSSATVLTEAEASRKKLAAQAVELEGSERHIRSIVDHAPYAILSADEKGVIRSINPFAADIFGISQPQAAGRTLASLFDASLAEALETSLRSEQGVRARLLQMSGAGGERSRRALSRQAVGIRGDGSSFPVSLTLTDALAGGQRFFTAFVRDLTNAVEQEQKVRQALTLTTKILDQSGVAICSTDAAGIITRFNRTAQQWLGYGEREVIGKLTPATFVDKAELQTHARTLERERGVPLSTDAEIFLALARRGESDQRDWTMIRKDGTRFPAHVAVAPLAEDSGKINGFVLVASDLSHHKEVEKMKNEFVSTVSHELRTPLTSVRGSLGLLAGGIGGKLPAQAQSLLEIAQRNTERLILLINDILDMEKIEAGKMRFNLKSIDLDALAAEATQAAEGLAATRKVKLVLRARSAGLRVHADDHRVMQVMSNLLSNGIKFSPEGGTVRVEVAVDGDRARFTVADHGSGIPEAAQPKIFQKFFQADSSSTREKSGTGLGLSICKALMERMDGTLQFKSKPGDTVFWFELPRERVPVLDGASATRRMLVVEDDNDAAAVLGQILRQAGFEIDIARGAVECKELLQKRRYDCMTLDMILPDQPGVELLGDLRRSDYGRSIPIIVVSIYEPDAASQAAAAAAQVADWLTKPIDSQRLLNAVRKALPQPARGVLLVDDDAPMGELMRHLLADIANVSLARSVAEGREQLRRQPFALVILDVGLPDGAGQELLPVVRESQPQTPVVIWSEKGSQRDVGGQVIKVISKSRTSNDELVALVQEILNGREAPDVAAKNPAG